MLRTRERVVDVKKGCSVKRLLGCLLCVSAIFCVSIGATRKLLIAYYGNWTGSRGCGCPVKAGNIAQCAPSLDAVAYAFADINLFTGQAILSDPWADVRHGGTWSDSNFAQLQEIKKKYTHIKIFFSIGGWTYREKFKDIVDAGKLDVFVRSCIALLSHATVDGIEYTYNRLFDGVDIDWEFDDGDPGSRKYADAYLQLVQKLRAEITRSKKPYLLTVALQAGPAIYNGRNAIAVKKVAALVNWINLMTYDFHGTWEVITDFAAPLYGHNVSDALSVDAAVKGFLNKGVPASKIVVGVSYEGKTYQKVPAGKKNGLGQKSGGPATGPILGKYEPGMIYYRDVIDYLLTSDTRGRDTYLYSWNSKAYASWLYSSSKRVFVSYESPASGAAKATYVRSKNLAGMMCWDICADVCGGALTNFIRVQLNG